MVNVKRYVGRTAREALAKLKAELGPDAVVISNRAIDDGVEIVAMPATEMQELNATVSQARQSAAAAVQAAEHVSAARQAPVADDEDDFTVTLGQHIARLSREQAEPPAPKEKQRVYHEGLQAPKARAFGREEPPENSQVRPFNPPRVELPREPAAESQNQARVNALENANAALMDELSSIKGMLERQLAGFAWNEISRDAPSRTQLVGELLEAGFSARMARALTEDVPSQAALAEARKVVRSALNDKLRAVGSDADIIDRGGVYALVGPTGVGKTTTTAKLAARCVVRHGADKIALITTDGYRIGAHEQLRIYGRILGIPVHIVRDASDLRQTLQDLRHKHIVLIDTIGMSQRDKSLADQAAMLTSAGRVRRLLLLNATASGDTLDDVVRAYEGPDLVGCIFSKVDEAGSLAPVIDVAARHELDVFYVANGQRVPEDLHLPNRTYLVHRALREIPADSPYKLDSAGAAMLMGSRTRRSGDHRRGEAA